MVEVKVPAGIVCAVGFAFAAGTDTVTVGVTVGAGADWSSSAIASFNMAESLSMLL